MGNPGKPKIDPCIQHFSHEHQLQLLNTKADPSLNSVPCVGCKLQPSEWVYACKPCNFLLHIPCSQMPQSINHPADPNQHVNSVPGSATRTIASQEAKQNFIQKFEEAQKVDKERMLSLIQGGNDGNDLTELQKYFRGDNSATGVLTQEYVQSMLGGHSDDGASENNLGDDRGGDQQEPEESLEALIVRLNIEARGRQAALDLIDGPRYEYTTRYSYI